MHTFLLCGLKLSLFQAYDVTGYDYVDIDDIVSAAEYFGTSEPLFDVNGDEYVGIDDIVEVAEHFGEYV